MPAIAPKDDVSQQTLLPRTIYREGFSSVISRNKNQKIQRLIITPYMVRIIE